MNRKKNYPLRDISDPTEAGKKRQERFMTDRKRRVSSFQKFLNISMLCAFAFAQGAKLNDGQNGNRPNILLIMTDQHQAKALSIAGNTNLKTPNLDKLAKNGVGFENAYVTFPLCVPSRSSIITGKMPHALGVNSNEKGEKILSPEDKKNGLGNVLKAAGYDCAYGGKWHAHQAEMAEGNGFEMIAEFGDIGLAEKSIEYLAERKEGDKPFFLVASFDNPHNICEWARNEPLAYGNVAAVPVNDTPELPINFKKSETFPEALHIEQNASLKIYPTQNYSEEDWRQYRYTYYRLVEKVDQEIGKILYALVDLDLDKNTLIIFTSDHGDGNASHGWNQKTALFQESVKVPFIMSYKGNEKHNGTNNETLVSNGLDLYPTICDFAGVPTPKDLSGKSLKSVFKGKKDDVFGPYKDRGFFKVSKIQEIVQIPDSVKGAHILIPFIGSLSATQDTKRTEAQAKKTADSIFKLVRRNKKKFATIADEMNNDITKDKGGDIGWITKDVAFNPNFDKDFANFLFFNKKGTIKVIKSRFGYQVIRIDESKNKQKAVKLATFGRKIEASQATENTIFQNAETLALALSNGKNFEDAVKEKGLSPQSAYALKMLDEAVPGIGNQRDIITWAHKKENKVGAFQRFDTNSGHVVAVITNKTFKGLMSAAKATITVRPILMNQKKAAIINKTMKGSTLVDIAKATKQTVANASAITMQSPVITGVGFEPKIVGAMYSAKENTLFNNVEGSKGVFAFVVAKREAPVALPNYDSYRNRISATRKGQTNLLYNAIKDATESEDNRGAVYVRE